MNVEKIIMRWKVAEIDYLFSEALNIAKIYECVVEFPYCNVKCLVTENSKWDEETYEAIISAVKNKLDTINV